MATESRSATVACSLLPTHEVLLADELEVGRASLAALPTGGAVASWVTSDSLAGESGVRAALVDDKGELTGLPFWVSGPRPAGVFGLYARPGACQLAEAGFVVGWKEPAGASGVRATRFSLGGEALSPTVAVASEIGAGPLDDEVTAVRTEGGFALLWDQGDCLSLRHFNTEGVEVDSPRCFGGASSGYTAWGEPANSGFDPVAAGWDGNDLLVVWLVLWGDPIHQEVQTGVFGAVVPFGADAGPTVDIDGSPLGAFRSNPQVVAVPDGAMVFFIRDGADIWGRHVTREGKVQLPVERVTLERGMQYMAAASLSESRAVLAWADCSGTVSARLVGPPMNPVGEVARHEVEAGESWSCDTPPAVAVLESGDVVVLSKYMASGGTPTSKLSFFVPSTEGCDGR